jgi:hypothetical protein
LRAAGEGYDAPMRRVLIVLMVVALLAVSVGTGVLVARWPHLAP